MEKHQCKLCFKTFMNGKALGGHMSKSHFTNLPLPPKTPKKLQEEKAEPPLVDLPDLTSSKFSNSEGKESEVECLGSGNKKFKAKDHIELLDAGSVMQADRESEIESTRKPTRSRSKRAKTMAVEDDQEMLKKDLLVEPNSAAASLIELEMVSSVTGAAAAAASASNDIKDVALSLLMLSRDSWRSAADDSVELKLSQKSRGKHRCGTCNKAFKSSQALGSHRIIHEKVIKLKWSADNAVVKPRNVGNVSTHLHECPFCGKVFRSGQALGGHKRSHFLGTSTTAASSSSRIGDSLVDSCSAKFQGAPVILDLNLPAPVDDDDDDHLISQHQLSAVSDDADFISNPVKHLQP